MPEIAVVSSSKLIPDDEVAWGCKAFDAQLREDFCPRWPEVPYQPVNFYASKKDLPVASGLSIIYSLVDDWYDDDKSAYHSWAGVPFVQIGSKTGPFSILLSHEGVEQPLNSRCVRTFVLPDGTTAAYEAADPVQGFSYTKRVEMFGEVRDIPVSAFVLRSYFDGGAGPTFYCPGNLYELAPRSIAPGGYLPILGPAGWEPRFGFGTDRALTAAKAENPTGRSAQRRAAL